jgi:mRNA-degrading endonuclease toxin of MazEF toxin-antitoxin module
MLTKESYILFEVLPSKEEINLPRDSKTKANQIRNVDRRRNIGKEQ